MQAAVHSELEQLCSLARLEPRHSSNLIEKMREFGFDIKQSFLKKADEFAGATHYLFFQRNGTYRLTIANEETSRFERLIKKYYNSLESAAYKSASIVGIALGPVIGVAVYARINDSYSNLPIDAGLGVLLSMGIGALCGYVMGKDINKLRVDLIIKKLERDYGHKLDGSGRQYDFSIIREALH